MANLIGEIETIERALVTAIVDTFNSVPLIQDHVRVSREERFPGSDTEDESISAVADPNNPASGQKITSIIQIGVPTVQEKEYTGDTSTQLTFRYPITFDLNVVDRWNVSDPLNPWRYESSSQMVKSVYLKARQKFKMNRTFGFDNVVHNYLQQEDHTVAEDEETKALIHAIDWSLEVQIMGVTV